MKKILLVLLSFLILCSCVTKDNDNVDEKDAETEEVCDTISNNEPYDEGESSEPDFSELLYSQNGIEIYGKDNRTIESPADAMMTVSLLIKNNNDFAVQIDHDSKYDINNDNFTGSITEYCNDFTAVTHPNGSDLTIEANSELRFVFDISLPNFNNQSESLQGDLVFHYNFVFLDVADGADSEVVADIDFALNSIIHYSGRDIRSDASNRNATIKGKIIDADSNPVCGAEIEIMNAIDEGDVITQTDNNGEFEIKVSANKSAITNMWHETVLKLSHSNYAEKYICVYPKTNQTNEVCITMLQTTEELDYTNTRTVDLGIQAYSYDTDVNKSVIAFTPFHSGLNYDVIEDKVNINCTDYDGNVLFQYHLNAEAPWVSVSDDGAYIVTEQAVDAGNENSTTIVVLNQNGDTVYTKDIGVQQDTPQGIVMQTIHSRCAELSHDNKYLAIGSDDGQFWIVDWQNDTILWNYQTHGQVRNFVFNEDNSILLVSSGDAFMYGFDLEGNLLFKTYVGSWATDMELADHYLAYTLKTGFDSVGVIDITTGEKVWTYAARSRGSGLAISKDNQYLWWGNDVGSVYSSINNVIFNLETGEIAYVLDTNSAQEAMYSDDGQYLVVKTATELEVFETKNYTRVAYIAVIDKNSGVNTESINQTVAVNADASKIVVAFNNDSSERVYGQAYYFELQEKRIIEHHNDSDNGNDESNDDAENAGSYRIEDNDIIFERDSEYNGMDAYDNVTVNTNVKVTIPSQNNNNAGANGLIINNCLTVQQDAELTGDGEEGVAARLEFAEGARALGIELYSEGGDLLNVNGEFINDTGSTLAFVWSDGKWIIE